MEMNKIKILSEYDIKQILNMNLAIKAVEEAYKQKIENNQNWSKMAKEYLKKCVDDSKTWQELANVVAVCASLQDINM